MEKIAFNKKRHLKSEKSNSGLIVEDPKKLPQISSERPGFDAQQKQKFLSN